MRKKIFTVSLIAAMISAIYFSGASSHFQLEKLKQSEESLRLFVETNFFLASTAYLLTYIIIAGLSLPFAGVFTLAGGAMFGVIWGALLVSFGSSIGALVAFLLARYLLRDWISERFKVQAANFMENTRRNGITYIAFLRLSPIFPFFLVNVLSGLSGVSALSFYLTSQICMLPATLIYVNAGSQLGKIKNLNDIISTNTILALALLGLVPIIGKFALTFWKEKR